MKITNPAAIEAAEEIVHLLGVGHVNDITHYIEIAMDAQRQQDLVQMAVSIDGACARRDAEIERLRKTLAFYANENNYDDDPSDIPGSPVPGTAPIWVDHGDAAQEALK